MPERPMDMAMAAALLGMEQGDTLAGAFALALVSHPLQPWRPPQGRELERARRTTRELETAGWTVLTVWECRFREAPEAVVRTIIEALESA